MADLTVPIVYNGLTCQPLTGTGGTSNRAGLRIVSLDFAPIPVDIRIGKKALADGANLSDAYLSGRPINVEGDAFGLTPGAMWDYVNDWMAAFSPRSPTLTDSSEITWSQATDKTATWATGYIPLKIVAQPIREPWHGEIRLPSATEKAHRMRVFATLMAPDPYKLVNVAKIEQTLTTSAVAVSYRGNAPVKNGVELWITLSGAGPNITVTITPPVAGIGTSSITIDCATLSTGVKCVYSFADRTLTYGATTFAAGAAANIIGSIVPGATARYTVNSGTAGNLTSVKLVHPEGFF